MIAEPDIISPDVDEGGQPGFTNVEVYVTYHTYLNPSGDPCPGCQVELAVDPAVPLVDPELSYTDASGKATFKVTSTDLPDNDGSTKEFLVIAQATYDTGSELEIDQQNVHVFIKDVEYPVIEEETTDYHSFLYLGIGVMLTTISLFYLHHRKNR
jgi:hypothetical protein